MDDWKQRADETKSEHQQRLWRDPEFRQRASRGWMRRRALSILSDRVTGPTMPAGSWSPEARRRMSDTMRRLWQDPGFRSKVRSGRDTEE